MVTGKPRPSHEQILSSPAEHAPPGITPDFVHPRSMEDGAVAALVFLYVLTTIVVLIRVYAQRRVARSFIAEDYVVVIAWIVYTGAFIPVGMLLARAPMGVHQWNLTLRQFARYLFLQYVEFIICGIVILLLKVPILLQCLRIFVPDGIRGLTLWASHAVLWANVAYYIAFTFIVLFVCNSQALFWDKTITHGKCLDIFGINVISAVICVVSDLLISLLPQRIVYHACATSAVRLYYNIYLWKHQTDITYQFGYISFWGAAQRPAGFFIVCLPSVPKAVNHFRGKPWFLHLETSLRSMLHWSPPKSRQVSGPRVPTIGGGGGKREVKDPAMSDIEFHNLVNKTDTSVVTRTDSRGDDDRVQP